MPHISNQEFVTKVFEATVANKIDWQPTALGGEFTATYAGKWALAVSSTLSHLTDREEPIFDYSLSLRNAAGEIILYIDDSDDERIARLHELARRRALKVDEAIADFLKELDEDIPF